MVLPILGALGKSDRDQTQATAHSASDSGIYSSLERHLDFDVEDVSLQSVGHLLEPHALEFDGAAAPLTMSSAIVVSLRSLVVWQQPVYEDPRWPLSHRVLHHVRGHYRCGLTFTAHSGDMKQWMRKWMAAACIAAFSTLAAADIIAGLYADAGIWSAGPGGNIGGTAVDVDALGLSSETNAFVYVVLEHPVPALPNVKLQHTRLGSRGEGVLSKPFQLDDVEFSAGETVSTEPDLTHTDAVMLTGVRPPRSGGILHAVKSG